MARRYSIRAWMKSRINTRQQSPFGNATCSIHNHCPPRSVGVVTCNHSGFRLELFASIKRVKPELFANEPTLDATSLQSPDRTQITCERQFGRDHEFSRPDEYRCSKCRLWLALELERCETKLPSDTNKSMSASAFTRASCSRDAINKHNKPSAQLKPRLRHLTTVIVALRLRETLQQRDRA